jgi:catechol 2,3-dioxygenase-like lactoylglutathione lyase family enzyme
MRISLSSILVDNQDKALEFYTNSLGFKKMADIDMGAFRWLTVVSPEGAEGVEVVLEPIAFPPAKTYQQALFEAGIPQTAFLTDDIEAEYQRLKDKGVVFRNAPVAIGPIISTLFEDTCGNLINLVQPLVKP